MLLVPSAVPDGFKDDAIPSLNPDLKSDRCELAHAYFTEREIVASRRDTVGAGAAGAEAGTSDVETSRKVAASAAGA